MLSLILNITNGAAIILGAITDGMWGAMTDESWEDVGDTNWEDWDATADS